MAVKKYNVEKKFPWTCHGDEYATIVVKANGGSVTVKVLLDDDTGETITSNTYTSDAAEALRPGKNTVTVTPSGGAEYSFTRG